MQKLYGLDWVKGEKGFSELTGQVDTAKHYELSFVSYLHPAGNREENGS